MAVKVDLTADLNARDHTGLCWSFLDEAAEPGIIETGAIVVVGEADAIAVAEIVELETIETGTIVRFRLLPGTVEHYAALVDRMRLSA